MKRWMKWAVALVVLALIVLVVGRTLSARKAQQAALAQADAAKTVTVIELAASDVLRAQNRELVRGLPITGALKAVQSAFLKAKVPGVLEGLTVREGDAVRAGQLIASIESTELQLRLRQAGDQARAAQAQIDIAQRQFDNNKALMEKGFISRAALDNSSDNLAGARATHQAALAAADVARKTLADARLVAPFSGIISQRLAQPGERVGVDTRIVEIVDLSRIELEAAVSAGDAMEVRVGQAASLRLEGRSEPVKATVARINPSTQAGSRNVMIYLTVEPSAQVRQGLFAEGSLDTGKVQSIAIPVTAVRTDRPAPYVQMVEGDRIVHRTVTPGARGESGGDLMVAVGGLAEGAVIVAGSVGALREGTAVKFTTGKPAATTSPAIAAAAPASVPAPVPAAVAAPASAASNTR